MNYHEEKEQLIILQFLITIIISSGLGSINTNLLSYYSLYMIIAGVEKMKVDVKQSTMVRPSRETPNRSLWSSNLDLLVPMFHVQTVYFYKPNGSSRFFETQVLKDALSDVLVPFYPAAGRMGKHESGRIEIHCNGEGILFVEAETSCSIDDLGDFTDSSKLLPLVPEVDYSGGRISSFPLVVLQVP